ncbi:MAG TPA: polysaccharide ABC transporter ATP-binding protein [Dissulfurispiraceae bacterium]|nr:polysaccharide ABC transporter ATP-binding protein [Dissulfurispiraceae bacterium]
MSDTVIKVEGVSKKYLLGHRQPERYVALRDVMTDGVKRLGTRLFRSNGSHRACNATQEEFYALRNLSFEIARGDRVGIIGRNGAGKSTLLKILSRITHPTTGRITIKGRVASLLEVGTGFHPELTGRENIFLNGAILGMTRAEIMKNFDAIVAFAEIEKFLDTPVKRYSSGMYVRLAFAVAAHLDPDILVVDEVLAVGDSQFQKKCLGKMEDVSAKEGRTVLFVSHNMGTVLSLCNRGILLHKGEVLADGTVSSVIDKYLGIRLKQEDVIDLTPLQRRDDYRAKCTLTEVRLLSREKNGAWQVPFGNTIVLGIWIRVLDHLPWLELSVALKTATGFEIASTLSPNHLAVQHLAPGHYFFKLTYRDLFLTPGTYRFDLGLKSEWGLEDYLPEACDLEILVSEKSAEMNVHRVLGALMPHVNLEVTEDQRW